MRKEESATNVDPDVRGLLPEDLRTDVRRAGVLSLGLEAAHGKQQELQVLLAAVQHLCPATASGRQKGHTLLRHSTVRVGTRDGRSEED